MNVTERAAGRVLGMVALAVLLSACGVETGTPAANVRLSCPDPLAGCAARIGNRAMEVGMAGEIKALQPFQVWVRAPGAKKIQANFEMVDMNMGLNRYTLRPDAGGTFRAQVTLPICISGARDWIMTLDIDDDAHVTMPFATRP
jgi:hypothetical protein